MRNVLSLLICIFSITQIWTQTTTIQNQALSEPEMRGLWVATVNNIDWPSVAGLSVDSLKSEAQTILDRAKSIGLNTIFLQVRPSSDVIYHSAIEPLTYYLVGDNDNFPSDFDPLNFWIEEAHRRGLELHAWINPLRATPKPDYISGRNHISKIHPEWLVKYADKQYLNPGEPNVRRYIANVVTEIVQKYDIDGIHFDDYFYPYPVVNEKFNDLDTYKKYATKKQSIDDWRRANVDSLVSEVSRVVHSEKPWLAFGISPFGVWRNKTDDERGSNTRAGITDYDVLYADVLHWAQMKWIDYVVPQIYWEAGNKAADFDELHNWWGKTFAPYGIKVFVGHAIYKINDATTPWKNPAEMPSQIEKVRNNENILGSVFFSYRQLNRDLLGLEEQLKSNFYVQKTLAPQLINTTKTYDLKVEKIRRRRDNMLVWECEKADTVRFYAIYEYPKGNPHSERILDIVSTTYYHLPKSHHKRSKHIIRIAPVDRFGREYEKSERYVVKY